MYKLKYNGGSAGELVNTHSTKNGYTERDSDKLLGWLA
jgi:hypothetical protein